MKRENNNDIEKFIGQVLNGKNVNAKETLEKVLKVKTAKRIKETLAS